MQLVGAMEKEGEAWSASAAVSYAINVHGITGCHCIVQSMVVVDLVLGCAKNGRRSDRRPFCIRRRTPVVSLTGGGMWEGTKKGEM